MVYIYILQLELNKFYIGKTNNPDIRLDSHFNVGGSKWTKLYKPIKVCEIIPDCDSYDEDKYTLKYIEKEGIDNVRGGSFSQVELSDEQIKLINQMIKGATDKCFNCGETEHFIKDCIKSKIQEYLKNENVNNENIKDFIKLINSIYEEIIELNILIKLTDSICIDEIKKYKEYNKLHEEERKYNSNKADRQKILSIQHQKQLLCKTLRINSYPNLKSSISDKYRVVFGSSAHNEEKNMVILGLELIKLNLEKKRRLKDIYNQYYSEDFIIELLSSLYEMDIKIIESQIS